MAQIISLSLVLRKRPKEFETSTVQIRFYKNSVAYYVSTGEAVETALWDAQAGRVKIPNRLAQGKAESLKLINERLDAILAKAKAALAQAERENVEFDTDYLKAALTEKKEVKKQATGLLLDQWAEFIQYAADSLRLAPGTIGQYLQHKKRLEAFAKAGKYTLTFENCTPLVCEKFVAYMRKKGINDSTAANAVKNLKVFCKWAYDHGHTTVQHYIRFKKPSAQKTDFVYLTREELHQLAQATLSPALSKVRDLFVLQSETGLRFSDLANLKPENIQGGVLRIVTVKTKDPLWIPLSPDALAIIRKYEGQIPKVIQNQPYNREIKEAARQAGIDSPTPITKYIQGNRVDTSAPKYEHLTSHTARRTFIIHALERGIRPEVLMKVTGHKDIKTLMRYVKITPGVVEAEFSRMWQTNLAFN